MVGKRKLVASALVAALLGVGVSATSATAAMSLPKGSVSGLIVSYKVGAKAKLEDGLAQVSKFSPVSLYEEKALGGGLHLVNFEHATTHDFAERVAKDISQDPQVYSAEVNEHIGLSSAALGAAKQAPPVNVSDQIRPSAVRFLRAIDDWSDESPTVGAVKLTWAKPAKLGGAKFRRFDLYASLDSGASFFKFKSTKMRSVRLPNLIAGKQYFFRIYAIVEKSGKLYRGVKRQVAVTPTAIPRPPVMNSPQRIFGSSQVSWQQQSNQQLGGLKSTYRVKAVLGDETFGCQTTSTSCILALENSEIPYQVTVTATNLRGSSVSPMAPTIQDAFYWKQWYLFGAKGVNAENAWAKSVGEPTTTVAVIDSGITRHRDVDDSLLKNADDLPYGYDFISNSVSGGDGDGWDADPTDPGDFSLTSNSSWHGTNVVGLISAAHDKGGIAGIAPNVKILPVRALGKDGGTLSDFLAAINWSAGIRVPGVPDNEHPARVINLSLASDEKLQCDAASQLIFKRVEAVGAIVVSAAGNSSTNSSSSFPANCPGVISVAATSFDGDLEGYSNFGTQVSISAPGGDVIQPIFTTSNSGLTVNERDSYTGVYGTSFAAPLVTGAIALMLSVNPRLKNTDVMKVLSQSATAFDPTTMCAQSMLCGPGILNVAAAVELADELKQ